MGLPDQRGKLPSHGSYQNEISRLAAAGWFLKLAHYIQAVTFLPGRNGSAHGGRNEANCGSEGSGERQRVFRRLNRWQTTDARPTLFRRLNSGLDAGALTGIEGNASVASSCRTFFLAIHWTIAGSTPQALRARYRCRRMSAGQSIPARPYGLHQVVSAPRASQCHAAAKAMLIGASRQCAAPHSLLLHRMNHR